MNYINLDANESPFGPSPRVVEAIRGILAQSNLYPDNDGGQLRNKLAEIHGVGADQVVVAAGLTSLLEIIARTQLSAGLNAITTERSFIVYDIATRVAGGKLLKVVAKDHGFDLDSVAAAIDGDTRLIFLANPNNPTGTLVTAEAVDRFLDKIPRHVTVVIDEAYFDFAQHFAVLRGVNYSRSLQHVRQGRNVVVLRTFSKAHGLAGLRVGYGIGPPKVISEFAKMRTTYSISSVAQAAALAALDDPVHTRKVVENNSREADRIMKELSQLGYHIPQTWANFVYCELNADAETCANRMKGEGIKIRPLGSWGAPTAVRVTIGTPQQNDVFMPAFRKAVRKPAAE